MYLGILLDESRRIPGRYRLDSYHTFRIPTAKQRPELDFLDDKTPVLYYGEPSTLFNPLSTSLLT